MTQIKAIVDLHTAEFPLLLDWAARTALPSQTDVESDPTIYKPQILYCQDVLPTAQGSKSVSYHAVFAAASPANITFANIFTVADTAQNKAQLGVTADNHLYMITAGNPAWVDVTPSGYAGGDTGVTVAASNGSWYCYLVGKGLYLIGITGTPSLTLQTLIGVPLAGTILGVVSAVNYLILYTATTLAWNSATNDHDFTPSLITGAGTSQPFDLEGQIVTIVPLNNGFCIYSNTNAVLGSWSNNAQFPWIFRNANNVAGIASYKQVNQAAGLGFHIALTYAGVTQVTPTGGTVITPEITDFLSSR